MTIQSAEHRVAETGGWAACRRFARLLWRIWPDRSAGRHCLRAMEDHRLRDLGITRAEAALEASKPFWR
jgi:uncharacterized protein YjiS (DUF1127 family)